MYGVRHHSRLHLTYRLFLTEANMAGFKIWLWVNLSTKDVLCTELARPTSSEIRRSVLLLCPRRRLPRKLPFTWLPPRYINQVLKEGDTW